MAWESAPPPNYPTFNPNNLGNVLGNLVNNYQQAQQGQQRTQNNSIRNQQDQMLLDQSKAFAGGVPMNPDGTPNYSAIMKTLAEKGDINAVSSLAPIIQQQQNIQGANAPDPFFGGGYSSGSGATVSPPAKGPWSGNQFLSTLVGAESEGNNSAVGDSGLAKGDFQFHDDTWKKYAKNVPGASQYASAADAPPDVQQAVAETAPISEWGARTKAILHAKFGNFDENQTIGSLAAEFDGGSGKGTQVASAGESDATAYATPDTPAVPPVSAAAGSTIPRADGGGSTPKGAVGGGAAAAAPQLAANNPAWAGINAALPVVPASAPFPALAARAAPPSSTQGSVASIVSGVVNDPQRAALVATNVAKFLHVAPGAPLTPDQAQRAQLYVKNYAQRTGQQPPAQTTSGGQGQPSAGGPIVPRYLQQKGFTDPQQAILAIDQDIARLSRFGPAAAGKIKALEDIRNGIEKRASPPKFGVIGRDQYGQPTYGWINPETQTVTPAATPSQVQNAAPPGLSDVHGEAFLKTADPNVANQVKALSEGRMQFPSGFALKSPYWQKMLQLVAQYDPSFDAVEYNARARARVDATSGKLAQNNNALNTGIGHVWQLAQAVDALHNGNWQSWNAVKNWWNAEFGGTAPTNFEAIRDRVAPEITKIWRGAGGAESDIKRDIATLSDAKSPAQLYGAIDEIAGLMESKIEANEAQYSNIMGPMADKLQMIMPRSQEILDRLESYSQPNQAAGGRSGGGGAHPPGTYNYDPATGNLEPVK